MSITKSRTRRELVETVFEAGQTRPMILEVWDGVAYAYPKGKPKLRQQISITGSFRHAQTPDKLIPAENKKQRRMDPERAAKAHMPTDPMMRALLGPRACGVAV